ncbi:MAG: Ig-like domain-containing protein [Gammaproteobacteria bacterium]|nr:Ig-like domain-containing protein [Gammaproteobacteria bacterium]
MALSSCEETGLIESGSGYSPIQNDSLAVLPPAKVLGSFPRAGQANVSTNAQFWFFIDGDAAPLQAKLINTRTGREVALTVEQRDGEIFRVRPSDLEGSASYYIELLGANSPFGFAFQTAPKLSADLDPRLIYTDLDDPSLMVISASSLHFDFNVKVDKQSASTAALQLISAVGVQHDVDILVDDNTVVLQPKQPLQGNTRYRVVVDGLQSVWGKALPKIDRTFDVVERGELYNLAVESDPSSRATLYSPLTGGDSSILDSHFVVKLADPERFQGVNPLVISAGSRISGESIQLRLNGELATGQDTGAFDFVMLDDAVGTLRANDLDGTGETASISMLMDLGFSVANRELNSLMSQHILGLQMEGLARVVKEGMLITMAGSTMLETLTDTQIEVNIFFSILATGEPVEIVPDYIAAEVVSVSPDDGQRDVRLDERLVVMFTEAVDPASAKQNIIVTQAGRRLATYVEVSGSLVYVTPAEAWPAGSELTVTVDGNLVDTENNAMGRKKITRFRTVPNPSQATAAAPTILSLFPGHPCILDLNSADYARGISGRCADGGPELKLHQIQADESMYIELSGDIDPSTVQRAKSCEDYGSIAIERVSIRGQQISCVETVDGRLEVSDQRLRFVPRFGWKPGEYYRIQLNAGHDSRCDQYEICSPARLPINLTPHSNDLPGGGLLETVFQAEAADLASTPLPMNVLYPADTNQNGYMDFGETGSPLSAVNGALDICDETSCLPQESGSMPCAAPGAEPRDTTYSCNPNPAKTALGPGLVAMELSKSEMFMNGAYYGRLERIVKDDPVLGTFVPYFISEMQIPTTNFNLNALVINQPLIPIDTGRMQLLIVPVENPRAPGTHAYIFESEAGDLAIRLPVMVYYSAPNTGIPLGAQQDLHYKPMPVMLESPVKFDDQGNIFVTMQNTETSQIAMEISNSLLGTYDGPVVFDLKPGSIRLNLAARAPKYNSEILP